MEKTIPVSLVYDKSKVIHKDESFKYGCQSYDGTNLEIELISEDQLAIEITIDDPDIEDSHTMFLTKKDQRDLALRILSTLLHEELKDE